MLHLFNKVFLKPDINFFESKDSIIISPKISDHLHHFEDDVLRKVNEIDFGRIHFYSTSYQELLDKNFNSDEQRFFDFLLSFDPSIQLTVYCDSFTYERILIRFLKTILPNVDFSTLYTIYKLTFLKYKYMWGYPYTPLARLNETEAAEFKQFGSNYKNFEEAQISWEYLTPFYISADISDSVGVEYQLATYLVTPTWKHKNILEQKIKAMVSKTLIHVYIDFKQAMLKHLPQLPGFDILTSSLEDFVDKNPNYRILLDKSFVSGQYETFFDTYSPEFIEAFIKQIIAYRYDAVNMSLMYEFDLDVLNPRGAVLDQVINLEQNSNALQILGAWDYQTMLNTYVLTHILSLSKNNDLQSLQRFSLIKV